MGKRTWRTVSHALFEAGLSVKFAYGLLQAAGGIVMLLLPALVNKVISFLFAGELREDPNDLVVNAIIHAFQDWHGFLIIYLIIHGILEVILVIGLWRKQRWAYPAAAVGVTAIMLYQLYLFATAHAPAMLALSIIDAVVLALLHQEYVNVRQAAG